MRAQAIGGWTKNPHVTCVRQQRRSGRLRAPPVSAAAVEFVPYTPVQKGEVYDLRLLQPHAVVSTSYRRRDEGFLALGAYLSGSNAAEARMLETQPIVMTYSPQGDKRMQVYVVPRDGGAATAAADLPAPSDPTVALSIAGGEVIAAIRFEGYATEEACQAQRQRLLAALAADGLALGEAEAGGSFRLAQYGPLHSLQTRINEIWLAIRLS